MSDPEDRRHVSPRPTTTREALGYLQRIGVPVESAPTLETLRFVLRAHVSLVPYENLGIMLANLEGRTVPSVDPGACAARVGAVGRAGYCFHQNAALGAGLKALGFAVERFRGHVWTLPEHRDGADLNHLVLRISGLPTDVNPGGLWWADAGLGEGFRDPVALVDGGFVDGGFAYSVEGLSRSGWSFTNAAGGSFAGIQVRTRPVGPTDVAAAHRLLATPPDGHFTRLLVAQRRSERHYDSLRGCVLARISAQGRDECDVTAYDEWRTAMAEVIRLPLADVSAETLRELFERTLRSHRTWDAAGRP